jgi:hypothetical protein
MSDHEAKDVLDENVVDPLLMAVWSVPARAAPGNERSG